MINNIIPRPCSPTRYIIELKILLQDSNFVTTFVTSMSTIMNNRLKQFLAAENITQAQFADNINVVRASVSHVLSGRNNPSFDFIKAMMAQYPRLNMDWLIFGKGRMYKDSAPVPDEGQLFPIDIEIPARITETDHQDIIPEPELSSNSLNTPDTTIQMSVTQRKVSKIIILYDDGTFQEM